MKKTIFLLLTSIVISTQASAITLYNCESNAAQEEEFHIEVKYENSKYTAEFFDNDTLMITECAQSQRQSQGVHSLFLECEGRDGNRQTYINIHQHGKSNKADAVVLESWGGSNDYYQTFSCDSAFGM
jgi:hypothetical protein